MTAKRLFGVVKGHREHIADHTGRLYSDSEVADLLNTVHEENEQLEEAREYYQENFLTMKTERNQFKRENELLKFQLDECRNNKLFSRRELEKENEELKKELKVYRKVASCSNCKYHNYDWDIDDGYGGEEYEVCDKGNDVTEGICEEWEEL